MRKHVIAIFAMIGVAGLAALQGCASNIESEGLVEIKGAMVRYHEPGEFLDMLFHSALHIRDTTQAQHQDARSFIASDHQNAPNSA